MITTNNTAVKYAFKNVPAILFCLCLQTIIFKIISSFFQLHYNNECKFREKLLANNYNAYESVAYPRMFIGLSKNGKTKRGNRVSPAMTVTHFLPRI